LKRAANASGAAMVDMFELAPHLQSNAALLPLGFKQRLALACATLHAQGAVSR